MEELCFDLGKFVLKRDMIQIHKDGGSALEKVRRKRYPAIRRPIEDYYHVKRCIKPTLQSKLQQTRAIDIPGRKEKKKQQAQKGVGKLKVEALGNWKRIYVKTHLTECIDAVDVTRSLASLELQDAILCAFFFSLKDRKEPVALKYLLENSKHFPQYSIKNLQKQFPQLADINAWGDADMYMPGHWIGIFGTAAGSGTGSLTIEARHAQWEADIAQKSKESVLNILPAMQELYTDSWDRIFKWGKECL